MSSPIYNYYHMTDREILIENNEIALQCRKYLNDVKNSLAGRPGHVQVDFQRAYASLLGTYTRTESQLTEANDKLKKVQGVIGNSYI